MNRLPWGHKSRHCVYCGQVGPRVIVSTTAFTGIAAALKRAYADGMVYGGNRLVERRIRAEADALEKGEFPKTVNSREELSSPEANKKA